MHHQSLTRMSARQQREARWRKLIVRQAGSGRSVAVFCRDESVPVGTFYCPSSTWARRLCQAGACIEVRLELPGGIALTITRR
jgi:hypothetical protein